MLVSEQSLETRHCLFRLQRFELMRVKTSHTQVGPRRGVFAEYTLQLAPAFSFATYESLSRGFSVHHYFYFYFYSDIEI